MDIRATLAARLYGQTPALARPEPKLTETPARTSATTGSDFLDTMRAGEDTVTAGLAGRADPQAVVEALAATEMAVRTAVAVRDKVVEAYQEILRMPV
ncbi:flagellar hook-basal body complex protein FliE [Amaricoccus solimangrovi]|uniref:Flagellar hook-basal body complex protein FliE n=1 Tax=Amaricoccus solimangrovi TaxID=2589815 RepID=A0A501WW74_9RHOB|nr:flagellar hook-basal body complex protein FliE [Amaricoccus solimangrovi]TPE52495.1 flagellar hook-basal body complex protein FliE [Amaricoccus solimangrovi]